MDIKFLQQPTLEELIQEWWQTLDGCRSSHVIAAELVRKIETWLPSEQTYCGSQLPVDQEKEIDGYNQALQLIAQRLKRKKTNIVP